MQKNYFYIENYQLPCSVALISVVHFEYKNKKSDGLYSAFQANIVKNEYSIFRCLKGCGFICLPESSIELKEDDLVLIKTSEIVTMASNASDWNFVQFRFLFGQDEPPFEAKKIFNIRIKRDEELFVRDLFYQQYSATDASSRLVSSMFLTQICRWETELETSIKSQNMYVQKIEFAIEYINMHLNEPLIIADLSKKFGISERHFRHLFQKVTGKSPKAYQQELKLTKCASLLMNTDLSIQEISEQLGYYSQYQLSRDFKKFFNMSPSEYRKS